MTARRARVATIVRSVGVVAERRIAPAVSAARYVVLDQLRTFVDRVEWAPLRISAERRARPASPRLPHALVLHLAHAARNAADVDAPLADVAAPLDADALASFLGTDAEGVVGALAALERAGAVHGRDAGGAEPWGGGVVLDAALLGPAPRCAALDWGRLALATAGAPSAWVAAHVLAERLVLDEWTPMPRSALERALGCGVSGVRSALDRLGAAGVVERREQRGGVSAYRFPPAGAGTLTGGQGGAGEPAFARSRPAAATPAALTPPALTPPVLTPPVLTSPVPTRPAPTSPAPVLGTAASGPATGVRLTIGGVELEVPPGLRVRVELGADGTPQISLVPVAPTSG